MSDFGKMLKQLKKVNPELYREFLLKLGLKESEN